MKRLCLLPLAVLVACGHDHITVSTGFWHSDTCHPEIYYVGAPPNATPSCKWTPVAPPPGVEIR
jgi:hypothetical protein